MIPTRTTQPYRKGVRQEGSTLAAMLKGSPTFLPNPADVKRLAASGRSKGRRVRSPLLDALAGRKPF